MASKVEIYNMALAECGARLVSSITEDNQSAIHCNLWYDRIRKSLLRRHHWNFALRRAALAIDSDFTPEFEYDNAYALPTDCLKLIKTDVDEDVYVVEAGYILTDEDTLEILYVKDQTDTSKFDDLFTELLSLEMAYKMARTLTESSTVKAQIKQDLDEKRREARSMDAQEGTAEDLWDDSWLDSRL